MNIKKCLWIVLGGVTLFYPSYVFAYESPQKNSIEKADSKVDDIASTAYSVITKWAKEKDDFVKDKTHAYLLYRKVQNTAKAMEITLNLFQDPNVIIVEDKNSCKYESPQLKMYYTDINSTGKKHTVARVILIFDIKGKQEVYILVFQKS
ncbi:MAG: hypothetical protein RRX93_01200 [Bacteroidales bacterium]